MFSDFSIPLLYFIKFCKGINTSLGTNDLGNCHLIGTLVVKESSDALNCYISGTQPV